MEERNTWLIRGIFLICDGLILFCIFSVSILLRSIILAPEVARTSLKANLPYIETGILLNLGILLIQGLYPGYGLTAVKELERMGKSITIAFFLLAAISYLNKSFHSFPRPILVTAWLLSFISLPLVHFGLRNYLSKTRWYGVHVIIFGEPHWAKRISVSLKKVRRLGWIPEKLLSFEDIKNLDGIANNAQIAILAPTTDLPVVEYARILNNRFPRVILLRQTDHFGSLWVEPRDLDSYLGLEFHYHLLEWQYRWIKRLIDILASLLLLVALSPFLCILSVLVVLTSPGPIFFKQDRIGQNLRHFKIVKFRTMVMDAEVKLANLLNEDPLARAEFEEFHKLKNDPRITGLGRFLRKFSLDEFPQLWNVLVGDMSLVGPRTWVQSEMDSVGSYAIIISRVKPGMTGWWQVLRHERTTFENRLEMDEYYISNWSLWLDIYILLKTILVVIKGSGS